jgi:hypothetical protein
MTPRPTTEDAAWLDELLPRARDVVGRVGEVPSRNRLMRELHIGAAKARTLRAALAQNHVPDPVASTSSDRAWPEATVPTSALVSGQPRVDGFGLIRSSAPAAPVRSWPVLVLAVPAWVSIWSGWVGLGELSGFGPVHPLPGIWDGLTINTAITLPIGVETYAAYALGAWLSGDRAPSRARRFAKWSALGSLLLGAAGQVIYHLMTAAGMTAAPWPVTTLVSCLPVVVLGVGAALAHLLNMHEGR